MSEQKRSRIPAWILSDGRVFIKRIAEDPAMIAKYGHRPGASKGHVRNAITFAVLTANERIEAAELAMLKVAPLDWSAPLAKVLKDAGIIFYNDKARALEDFRAMFDLNPTPYHPLPDESCSEYRDRIHTMNIRGLGYVKASFAAYLAYGGGDVICPDRHILNIYTSGGFEDWMHKRSARAHSLLKEVEGFFVEQADLNNWPSASALQWAVWCEAIGLDCDHAVVTSPGYATVTIDGDHRSIYCPTCGATWEVDLGTRQDFCRSCNATYRFETEKEYNLNQPTI